MDATLRFVARMQQVAVHKLAHPGMSPTAVLAITAWPGTQD